MILFMNWIQLLFQWLVQLLISILISHILLFFILQNYYILRIRYILLGRVLLSIIVLSKLINFRNLCFLFFNIIKVPTIATIGMVLELIIIRKAILFILRILYKSRFTKSMTGFIKILPAKIIILLIVIGISVLFTEIIWANLMMVQVEWTFGGRKWIHNTIINDLIIK